MYFTTAQGYFAGLIAEWWATCYNLLYSKMKEFFQTNKVFIIVVLATLAVIVGGIFLMGGGSPQTNPTTVNSSILSPAGVYETSGFADGVYLAASPSATVTLVEFGDYECPACAVYAPFIKQVLTEFPGKVNYVFRNYPLPQHKNGPISSYAVEAAGIQDKYWEMQEKVYATQNDWAKLSDPTGLFVEYAKGLELNMDQFLSDMGSQKVKDIVERDTNDGNTVRLSETPTFYINGKKVTLSGDPNQLKNLIRTELGI